MGVQVVMRRILFVLFVGTAQAGMFNTPAQETNMFGWVTPAPVQAELKKTQQMFDSIDNMLEKARIENAFREAVEQYKRAAQMVIDNKASSFGKPILTQFQVAQMAFPLQIMREFLVWFAVRYTQQDIGNQRDLRLNTDHVQQVSRFIAKYLQQLLTPVWTQK